MSKTKTSPKPDVLGPEGELLARTCVDCFVTKPIEEYQRSGLSNNRATDCKACRHAKIKNGVEHKTITAISPATKEWVIAQATLLYNRAGKDSDKARYLALISKNLNGEAKNLTDDAKVLRDLIASKKRLREEA